MPSDNDYTVDLEELRRHIDRADVVCIFFPILRQTLVLDSRVTDIDGPMVRVAPMVQNSEERLAWLEAIRPRLGRPESVVLSPWPKGVAVLQASGILDAIRDHLADIGAPGATDALDRAYAELVSAEREDLRSAIVGDNYRTVWSRR